jgi:hypothetical protein
MAEVDPVSTISFIRSTLQLQVTAVTKQYSVYKLWYSGYACNRDCLSFYLASYNANSLRVIVLMNYKLTKWCRVVSFPLFWQCTTCISNHSCPHYVQSTNSFSENVCSALRYFALWSKHKFTLSDFRLPPRIGWEPRSSGPLLSVEW